MNERPSAAATTGAELIERLPAVTDLLERGRSARLGLERAWLVGGAVRDAALGRACDDDIDISVEGPGTALARQIAAAVGGEVVAEHEFGTATVSAVLAGRQVRIDVATCRTETYAEPGALPRVRPGAPIEVDLARRDVAANAVAVALAPDASGAHAVLDPHDGLGDIARRQLRVLHDQSFVDDPTRIFRVARYAARLGFEVDARTASLARTAVRQGALGTVSADRVRAELELLLGERASGSLALLAEWGVVERLDPRIGEALGDDELLAALDTACGDDRARSRSAWTLRLAALVEPLGPDAGGWLRWLGFPGEVVARVTDHLRVLDVVRRRAADLRELPNSALYRELGEVDDDSFALAVLAAADDERLRARLGSYRDALRDTRLTVRGDDVTAAGVPRGPAVGRILGELFLRRLDGELRDAADERRALGELAAEAASEPGQ